MTQSSSDDPSTHDHGESHGGEDYPRLELNRLIGNSQAQTHKRRTWQAVLLSVGLILIALGLPTSRYFGGMQAVWQMAGSGPTPQSLMSLPILATRSIFGIGLEPASFLWSAILYGCSLFLLMRLMYRIGFDHEVGLTATLVALTSPLAWLGGTLPLDFSAGLFGSTLLCTSLFQSEQTKPQGYLWRAASYLLFAFMLQPETIWLAPAAIWAVRNHGQDRGQSQVNAFGLALVSLVSLWVSVTVGGGKWSELWQAIIGSSPGSLTVLAGIGFWTMGLGCAWLGLGYLLMGRREAEELPAPTWVLAWIAVGVVPLFAGGLDQGPRGGFLLPIAAIGVADWMTRRTQVQHRSLWAASLLAGQVLLTLGSVWILRQGDTDRAWSQVAQTQLTPDHLFVTRSPTRAYLAHFRQGLVACQIDGRGTQIHASKPSPTSPKGLVLDGWTQPPQHANLPAWIQSSLPPQGPGRQPTTVLTKEGLIPTATAP